MFDEIDGFMKIHDGIRYLVLFDYEWCDKICDRIKYLTQEMKMKEMKTPKNLLIFSQKKAVLIFQKTETPNEKILYVSENGTV